MRTYVDFHVVFPQHAAIDARLVNWGRWCWSRPNIATSPMFRLYRSTEVHRQETGGVNPVDTIDAQRVQKAVSALPSKPRMAISWCYVKRSNPDRAARTIGESVAGLAELVHTGRQMLINRNA